MRIVKLDTALQAAEKIFALIESNSKEPLVQALCAAAQKDCVRVRAENGCK